MNLDIYYNIGLNELQAKAFYEILSIGSLTPPALAERLKIKRTNAYAVLEQLEYMELVYKKEIKSKYKYFPSHPSILEQIVIKKRKDAEEQENKVRSMLPNLLNLYHQHSTQPGVRFYQGIQEIKKIYSETIELGSDIYVFRSLFDQDVMTVEFYDKYKKMRANKGIRTFMLNPSSDSTVWNEKNDKALKIERTYIPNNIYSADVEISVYGDKVAIISFGKEVIGTVIDSPQIADAMRQIYSLAKLGATNAK